MHEKILIIKTNIIFLKQIDFSMKYDLDMFLTSFVRLNIIIIIITERLKVISCRTYYSNNLCFIYNCKVESNVHLENSMYSPN